MEVRTGGYQERHSHPFNAISLGHSPPSHVTIKCFCFSDNPIPFHIYSPLFLSPTPCILFSLLCKCLLLESLAHSPPSHLGLWHSSFFAYSHFAQASLPVHLHHRPLLFHSHLLSPPTFYRHLPLPGRTLPYLGHSPPSTLVERAHSPRPWGPQLERGRAGMRSRGPFSSAPPPRPAPPSILHRLPGSRPARPPLRGGLRRRRRRKEPPFATAERTGRAEPDPGAGAGLGPGGRRWGAAPPQEDPGA